MGFNLAKWFIEGEVDWEFWNKALAAWGPAVAGALFGAGWWCWADAYVYQHAVVGAAYPFKYNLPGIVATVAMIMINLLPRRDLMDEGREEGEEFRARLWLFISFLIALGAVAGSVAVLVSASQQKDLASVGVGSVLQCGLILLGSLMFWAFRSGDQGGYGYIS
ncbi:transmembrane 50-like protein [Micractinium conductrix]|uniref:Transmembrane 50-like protein n=1 Tax=Micractinium conductrix TaxID=554055 RepID=A0A2P6UYY8_9CHLO|nr:transmembrane 50-like protein [Micractinium conductrix]|eukprot:PSC67051.1 transmembrane 50-like protein [Micractinium conductrix]